MEFPGVGDRCFMDGCGQLDFLPVKCSYCNQWYCKDHLSPFSHQCPNRPDNVIEEELPKERWQYKCEVSGCNVKELVPIKCCHCSLQYCIQHRHPDQHGCSSLAKDKSASSKNKIDPTVEQHNKVKDQITSKLQDTKEKGGAKGAMAKKLALMKLKGRAEGDKTIPQSERVYFIIDTPNPEQNPKPLDMFLSKVWSMGKMIDVVATRARIKNRNNQADAPKLHLFKAEICLSIPADKTIGGLINEGILEDGDSIFLKYVSASGYQ